MEVNPGNLSRKSRHNRFFRRTQPRSSVCILRKRILSGGLRLFLLPADRPYKPFLYHVVRFFASTKKQRRCLVQRNKTVNLLLYVGCLSWKGWFGHSSDLLGPRAPPP